jgi:translation initiation factor IF-3
LRRKRRISKKQSLRFSVPINQYIKDQNLRVLDEENNVLGVIPKNEALLKAKEANKDLVLIAPKATPAVAKIIDFNKYLYQLAKKSKGEKKGKTETKELKIGLFMAEHDLERQKERAAKFLKSGHQVRLSLWLKGRELGKKDQARAFLFHFLSGIKSSKIVTQPSMHGKVLRAVISIDKTVNAKTKSQEVSQEKV